MGEFKKWAKTTGYYEHTWGLMEKGWNARQPEIDALRAEVEMLRKDAERYHYWRSSVSAITNSKGERIDVSDVPPDMFDSATDELIADEAMKETK